MGIGASMTTLTTFRALSGDPLPGLGGASMGDQEADEGKRAGRTGPDPGPVVGDGLLPQERHVQHSDPASWDTRVDGLWNLRQSLGKANA